MQVDTAVTIINKGLTFIPGWDFHAVDYRERHENAVKVTLTYVTRDYRRSEAPDYTTHITPYACYVLDTGKVDDLADLARELVGYAADAFTHEAREALRFGPTWWGPLNPHMTTGQARWGDPRADHTFGVV